MVVHVDDVPIIGPDSHGQQAEAEQTSKPSREDRRSIPHPRTPGEMTPDGILTSLIRDLLRFSKTRDA